MAGGTKPEYAMRRNKRLTFWGADEHDDSLVREVIAGRKTVTADVLADYYAGYGELGDGAYAAGDLIEVRDGQGRPRCLIRATRVEIIRFGHIPEPVWRGEGFAGAHEFGEVHVRCLPQYDLHDDFAFVALHFELVEVIPAA
jgi:uncharacterized protein YhfF